MRAKTAEKIAKNKKIDFKDLILIINTAIAGKIFVALFDGVRFRKKTISGHSDKLLILVDKILKDNKFKPRNLSGIIVVSGPGSFTAVRQGVVVANALSFVLQVPVISIKLDEFKDEQELQRIGMRRIKKRRVGELVLPFYGKEPNITKPKD